MKATELNVGNQIFKWGSKTYLMGILNITPDSFSGDGLLNGSSRNTNDEVISTVRGFIENGADIIDVGGESTRPGARVISPEEELARVIPVIQLISSEFDVLISIDTYHALVAEAAIQAGARIVNDVWGFKADPEIAGIAARFNVPVILMHNRSSWANSEIKNHLGGHYVGVPYDNLIEDIKKELLESVSLAHEAGIPEQHIILDPGIGFGKTVDQNLELIDRLEEIKTLGFPLLYGPSRKSFIGFTLDLPVDERVEGTAAAVALGIAKGADIVRVHDVGYMNRVIRMTDAIIRREN